MRLVDHARRELAIPCQPDSIVVECGDAMLTPSPNTVHFVCSRS